MENQEPKPRILFVDDESSVLSAIRRALYLKRDQWEMVFAESGREALALLEKKRVDIVISDMRMPEMDGARLLLEIRQHHPDTIRMVLSGQADREQILRCVKLAHRYFTKPCAPDELAQSIDELISWKQKVVSAKVKELASCVSFVPSSIESITALLEELEKSSPDIGVVRNLICHDVGMSVKLIQLVSSSFFGDRQVIYDPGKAATLLGMDLLKQLVLEAEIFAEGDAMGRRIANFGQQAVEMAYNAKEIAQIRHGDIELQEQAFLGGLLTNVGKMIMIYYAPERYQEVLDQVSDQCINLVDAERQVFGLTHTEVGGYILSLWGLPEKVIEAVYYYKEPAKFDRTGFHPVTAVFLADTIGKL